MKKKDKEGSINKIIKLKLFTTISDHLWNANEKKKTSLQTKKCPFVNPREPPLFYFELSNNTLLPLIWIDEERTKREQNALWWWKYKEDNERETERKSWERRLEKNNEVRSN
jgi:hypothetical protein